MIDPEGRQSRAAFLPKAALLVDLVKPEGVRMVVVFRPRSKFVMTLEKQLRRALVYVVG